MKKLKTDSVNESYKVDITDLLPWLESHGGHCSALIIGSPENHNDRTVRAKSNIKEGTEIAYLPDHLIFSKPNLMKDSSFTRTLSEKLDNNELPLSENSKSHILLYSSLLFEKFMRKRNSIWFMYLWSLPAVVDVPLLHPLKQIEEQLGHSNAQVYVSSKRAQLGREWKIATSMLETFASDFVSQFTLSRYVWAHTIFSSRAFPRSVASDDTRIGDPASEVCDVCLFPVLDMLDHKRGTKITWAQSSANKNGISFVLGESVSEGNIVYNNYGPKSNGEWLLGYGFVQETFVDDFLVFKVNFKRDPLAQEKAALVHKLLQIQVRDFTVESFFKYGESWDKVVGSRNVVLFRILLSTDLDHDFTQRVSTELEEQVVSILMSKAADLLEKLKLKDNANSLKTRFEQNCSHYMKGQVAIANRVINFGNQIEF